MLFARWRHHIRFASGYVYAPFNAMVTKISKWSRIQDSCRITPKIEPLVAYAMPDIRSKFQKDPSITFWVILLTHRQTDKQTKTGKNITSLAEVNIWGLIATSGVIRVDSFMHMWLFMVLYVAGWLRKKIKRNPLALNIDRPLGQFLNDKYEVGCGRGFDSRSDWSQSGGCYLYGWLSVNR